MSVISVYSVSSSVHSINKMKKAKLAITIIYISVIILVSSLTIFLIAYKIKQGSEIYFKQHTPNETKLPIQEKDVDQIIELLRASKIL